MLIQSNKTRQHGKEILIKKLKRVSQAAWRNIKKKKKNWVLLLHIPYHYSRKTQMWFDV